MTQIQSKPTKYKPCMGLVNTKYLPVDFKIWKVCVEKPFVDWRHLYSPKWSAVPTHKKWMSRHLEFLTHWFFIRHFFLTWNYPMSKFKLWYKGAINTRKCVQMYWCMILVVGGSICQEHEQLKQMPDAQIRCQILPIDNFFGLLSTILNLTSLTTNCRTYLHPQDAICVD